MSIGHLNYLFLEFRETPIEIDNPLSGAGIMGLNVLKPQKVVKGELTVQNICCIFVASYSD